MVFETGDEWVIIFDPVPSLRLLLFHHHHPSFSSPALFLPVSMVSGCVPNTQSMTIGCIHHLSPIRLTLSDWTCFWLVFCLVPVSGLFVSLAVCVCNCLVYISLRYATSSVTNHPPLNHLHQSLTESEPKWTPVP